MTTIEAVTFGSKAEIPSLDTPEALVEGLETRVREGAEAPFDDLAFVLFYDTAERMAVVNNPYFQALLERIDAENQKESMDESTRPNVIPGRTESSVKHMIQQPDGIGGGFSRLRDLNKRRYVTAPAYFPDSDLSRDIELDLEHGISFDGKSLIEALFNEGFGAEVIGYRNEPAFPAYRDKIIGTFLAAHALS